MLKRAQVWAPRETESLDLKRGPSQDDAFTPGETVTCTYVARKLSGATPKFDCRIDANDEVKVKYGLENGEVYGEVVATRLLWALGFGADRMYPVRVVCRNCPSNLNGTGVTHGRGEVVFDPAVIERKAPGAAIETHENEGWSWKELDLVDEHAGGAPIAHRDALKLLAAIMQHTDSKAEQQRMVCLDQGAKGHVADGCERPFMLINDLGNTFGVATMLNRAAKSSVNLERWSEAPVWRDKEGCTAYLPKSLTGTLENPMISDAGRTFLAGLLSRLSDKQLHDLFEVARVELRTNPEAKKDAPRPSIDEWVSVFKRKRDEVANRRCDAAN